MGRRAVFLLIALAVVARVALLGWDSGLLSPHPDERQVAFVTERTTSWDADPGFSAYGSLHFLAIRGMAAAARTGTAYPGLLRAGRMVSVTASVLALLLAVGAAWTAWGRRTALLVLALAAVVPLDLQQAHFATVEAHHAFWVMAALVAAWRLAWRGGVPAAALAGAAWGASLAVKVASLPLAVPLGIAVAAAGVRRGAGSAARASLAVAGSALAAFALGQPSAFPHRGAVLPAVAALAAGVLLAGAACHGGRRLRVAAGLAGAAAVLGGAAALLRGGFAPEYLRGVLEQIAMATGRADLPYTRVYRHTLAVLYPLRELALWALGPALLAAALAGAASAVRIHLRRLRRDLAGRLGASGALTAVLLAWTVPMALRLATLRVKYLRYWEPLVLPAVLLAAWWLLRLPRRVRRRAVAATVAVTAVWGAAYLAAFTEPHPHEQARRWLGERVEAGRTVALEHWDEGIALPPGVRTVTLTPYDLPDDAAKARRMCRTLAGADWVVLTSNRIRRTVLANTDRFPRTARLERLLLTGGAGFLPATRFGRAPRLLGVRFPVELADESFANYGMPRVVVLRRVSDIDPGALAARLERPVPYLEGMDAGALERWITAHVPQAAPRPGAARQTVDTLSFLLVVLAAGAAVWLLLLPWLAPLPDAGAGLALAAGWVFPGLLAWLGSEAGLWRVAPATVLAVLLVLCGAAGAAARGRPVRGVLRRRRRGLAWVAGTVLGVFLLFLAVRASNPAVWWGEKPMDLTFLEAFLHAGTWPPGEPWMAGMPLHYYYLGDALGAALLLASGVGAAVGYNLLAALLPALAAGVLAGLGLALARRRGPLAAVAGPAIVLLSGNLAWPFLLGLLREGRWFDAWWATSRVIPGFAIDEYPLWTALFADLHAHFLALPVLAAALGWGWLALRPGQRRPLFPALVTGVLAGALVATNPWDVPVMTAALATGLLATRRRGLRFTALVAAAGVAAVVAAPFLVELAAWLRAGAGGAGILLNRGEHAPAWAVLEHMGQFLVPLGVAALAVLGRRAWLGAVAAAAAAGAGAALGSGAAAAGLGSMALLAAAATVVRGHRLRLAFLLGALGSAVIAACELVTVMDRMNTLFKFYGGAWLLLGGGLVLLLLASAGRVGRAAWLAWAPLGAVAALALPLGVAQGVLQPRTASPRPALDGEAYLERHDPSTAWLAGTLAAAARPGDVVAEAAGPSYQEYTRIAMHTGLPTVVGWEWHLRQRGQPAEEIAARERDLETLYRPGDPAARRAVLDRYRVRWVVVGSLERERYGIAGDDPFEDVPGVVPFCGHGQDRVWRVVGGCPEPGGRGAGRRADVLARARSESGTVLLVAGGGVVVLAPDGTPERAVPAPEGAAGVGWLEGRPAAFSPGGVFLLGTDGRWRRTGSRGP